MTQPEQPQPEHSDQPERSNQSDQTSTVDSAQQPAPGALPNKSFMTSIGILAVILVGFIIMRLWLPSPYMARDWSAIHVTHEGQALTLKLHSERKPNGKMVGVARELDCATCKLTLVPDGGPFSEKFIQYMAGKIGTQALSMQPAVVFINSRKIAICSPIPLSFTAIRNGEAISSYDGEGSVLLRPQSGAMEAWVMDWERDKF